jgi:hypothetical protein
MRTGSVVAHLNQQYPYGSFQVLWENGLMSTTHFCNITDLPELGSTATLKFETPSVVQIEDEKWW